MYYYFIKAPSVRSPCAAHNEQKIPIQVPQTIAPDVTGIWSKYLRTFSPSLCKYRAICLASSVFPEIATLNKAIRMKQEHNCDKLLSNSKITPPK